MATQIKLRRDTYQNWYDNNPVLALGEPGWDVTNKKLKIGDGSTTWRLLAYFDDQVTDFSSVATDIVPATDNTYNIGSPDKRWQHGYFANGSLYVGDIKLSNDNGTLLVQQVTDAGLISEAPVPNTPGVVTTDRIVNGLNSFAINAAGALELNGSPYTGGTTYNQSLNTTDSVTFNEITSTILWQNSSTTRSPNGVNVPGATSTVVFATPNWFTSIKLVITVEGQLDGDGTFVDHTQTCEATIAATYNTSAEPIMSVYGIVYTSPTPLATFTVARNGITGNIEVTAVNSQATNGLNVRVQALQFVSRYD